MGIFLLFGKPSPKPAVIPAAAIPAVDIIQVTPAPRELMVTTQGTVQPRRQIDLVAQVGGKIEKVAEYFSEGGFFDAGGELAQLEQQDYRFELTRAIARVADARQLLSLEKGRVRQASREWRDLKDKDANDLFLRRPQLASAKATLAAAQAEQEQAQLALERTSLRAPFDGRILTTFVDIGQYVTPGTPVARIYATDAVEVRLPLTDRQISLLDLSMHYRDAEARSAPLAVTISGRFGGREWQWQGSIPRTDASIDPRSRVVYAVAEIPDPFARDRQSERPPLLIGQFVQARIPGRRLDAVLSLPRQALRPENSIWVLDDRNRIRIEPVRVLQYGTESVAVQGDFVGSVRVITSPLTLALPGMEVDPRSAEALGS